MGVCATNSEYVSQYSTSCTRFIHAHTREMAVIRFFSFSEFQSLDFIIKNEREREKRTPGKMEKQKLCVTLIVKSKCCCCFLWERRTEIHFTTFIPSACNVEMVENGGEFSKQIERSHCKHANMHVLSPPIATAPDHKRKSSKSLKATCSASFFFEVWTWIAYVHTFSNE